MKVINIIGSPCSGKSTIASFLFFKLKVNGYNVELASEYAKDLVYQGTRELDQLEIFAMQRKKLLNLEKNGVDVVVTDSPLILTCIYSLFHGSINSEHFCPLVLDLFRQFNNFNIFLERKDLHSYKISGRIESKEESSDIEGLIKQKLKEWDIKIDVISNSNEILSVPDLLNRLDL